jgi:ribosomal protein L35
VHPHILADIPKGGGAVKFLSPMEALTDEGQVNSTELAAPLSFPVRRIAGPVVTGWPDMCVVRQDDGHTLFRVSLVTSMTLPSLATRTLGQKAVFGNFYRKALITVRLVSIFARPSGAVIGIRQVPVFRHHDLHTIVALSPIPAIALPVCVILQIGVVRNLDRRTASSHYPETPFATPTISIAVVFEIGILRYFDRTAVAVQFPITSITPPAITIRGSGGIVRNCRTRRFGAQQQRREQTRNKKQHANVSTRHEKRHRASICELQRSCDEQ